MDEAEARLGARIGNYRLESVIGRGGMGVVYRAEHVYLRRPMAVKVLNRSYFDQPEAVERFLREAQTAGVIDHPNIVGVTDFGEAPDGTIYLVMAHVEGQSLERVLRLEGRLPLFRALVIASQVARALGAAHERSVVHHDLKPDNISLQLRTGGREIVREVEGDSLFEPEGTYDFVTVLDFGAAKYLDQASAGTGVVIGTPAYMAPETAQDGVADARSDIYSLGIVFYEMLTGSPPFEGDEPTEIMLKHVREPVPPARWRCPEAEITEEAEQTIQRALAKRPGDRYQNMADLHRDLERCYGSVKFRRTLEALPPGVTSFESLRRPIPLTQVKRRPEAEPGETAGDGGGGSGGAGAPILLTRRKSERHKTLPLGAQTVPPPPEEHTPPPEGR
jgi:eukaryotic-like serine/threonine-protein kinase